MKGKEKKHIVVGSIAAVVSATIIFGGASQVVKALEVDKPELVETNYEAVDRELTNDGIASGDEKQDYNVKFVGKNQPSANDMSKEEAAEIASRYLWEVFHVDLNEKTLKMTYEPSTKTKQRATWEVTVKINDDVSYDFILDSITGERHSVGKRVYHEADIPKGFNKDLLKNNEEYKEKVKDVVEEYRLLSSKLISIDYISQGFDENELGNKNSNITFQVISEDDEKLQITISTYNKEVLSIEFDSWLKEAEHLEQRLKETLSTDPEPFLITDELIKDVEKTNKPILIEINE